MVLNIDFKTIRSLFYLITPNESTFASVDQVPNYAEKVTELWFVYLLEKKLYFRQQIIISYW